MVVAFLGSFAAVVLAFAVGHTVHTLRGRPGDLAENKDPRPTGEGLLDMTD